MPSEQLLNFTDDYPHLTPGSSNVSCPLAVVECDMYFLPWPTDPTTQYWIARELEHPVNGQLVVSDKYISRLRTAIGQLSTVPGVKCVRSSDFGSSRAWGSQPNRRGPLFHFYRGTAQETWPPLARPGVSNHVETVREIGNRGPGAAVRW